VPVHPLYEQHVRPTLERLTETMKDQGADRSTRRGERAAAKQLVEEAWRAAAAGAAREHALRRLFINRQLQDMADELEVRVCLEGDWSGVGWLLARVAGSGRGGVCRTKVRMQGMTSGTSASITNRSNNEPPGACITPVPTRPQPSPSAPPPPNSNLDPYPRPPTGHPLPHPPSPPGPLRGDGVRKGGGTVVLPPRGRVARGGAVQVTWAADEPPAGGGGAERRAGGGAAGGDGAAASAAGGFCFFSTMGSGECRG